MKRTERRDRWLAVLAMREERGLTFRAMGECLGLTDGRAWQLYRDARRWRAIQMLHGRPLETWGELREVGR